MTEMASPQESPGVPEETHLEKDTTSTRLETAVPQSRVWKPGLHLENRMQECKGLKPEDFLPLPFPPLGSDLDRGSPGGM